MERSLIHIDMDAFFASVELITRPELRGRPVIVAGESERGVVTAATYEARAFGIHSGMALGKAKALCPAAIRISPDRAAYSRISRGVMELFAQVTPVIEQISIDEAFLDVTGSIKRLGPARQIAEGLRQAVRDNFQITCSAGIAPSKSVAKIASKLAKPDGLLEVPPDQVEAFLRPLPVGSLWGVGPKAQAALRRLGIATIGDLADTPDALAIRALGSSAGAHLLALARGQDDEPLAVARAEKSIGTETTFDHDLPPGEEVRRAVIRLADKAAWRLREAGLACRTVSVKVRSAEFETFTRSKTLASPTDQTKTITEVAHILVNSLDAKLTRVRLVGVRLENLSGRSGLPVQPAFDQVDESAGQIDQVRDEIRRRFGGDALGPGSLIP